jgi:hypothetical protein
LRGVGCIIVATTQQTTLAAMAMANREIHMSVPPWLREA